MIFTGQLGTVDSQLGQILLGEARLDTSGHPATITIAFSWHTRIEVMANQSVYDVGDLAEVTATLKVAGVLSDPTTLVATIITPLNVQTTDTYPSATFTRTTTGTYKLVVDLTEAGDWAVVFTSTGTAKGVETKYITVRSVPSGTPAS